MGRRDELLGKEPMEQEKLKIKERDNYKAKFLWWERGPRTPGK